MICRSGVAYYATPESRLSKSRTYSNAIVRITGGVGIQIESILFSRKSAALLFHALDGLLEQSWLFPERG
jgi:hypothetical protein